MMRYMKAMSFVMALLAWWDEASRDGKIDKREFQEFLALTLATMKVNEAQQIQRITAAAIEIAEALGLVVELDVGGAR